MRGGELAAVCLCAASAFAQPAVSPPMHYGFPTPVVPAGRRYDLTLAWDGARYLASWYDERGPDLRWRMFSRISASGGPLDPTGVVLDDHASSSMALACGPGVCAAMSSDVFDVTVHWFANGDLVPPGFG